MFLLLKKSILNKLNVLSVLQNVTIHRLAKCHYSSKCPKKRNMILKEQDNKIVETSYSSDNEEEVVTSEKDIQSCIGELLVVQ